MCLLKLSANVTGVDVITLRSRGCLDFNERSFGVRTQRTGLYQHAGTVPTALHISAVSAVLRAVTAPAMCACASARPAFAKSGNDQGRNYMMNPPWRFLTSLCVGAVVAMLMAGCSTREASHDGNLLQTANTPHESASSCETAAELKTFIRLISDARNSNEIDNALRESFGLTGEGRSELSISSRCWKITIGAPFDHPLRFVEIVLKDEVHLGSAKSPKIKGSCISVDSLVDDKSTGKDRVVERQIGSDIPIVHLSTGAAQLSRMRLALHDDCVFFIEVIR